MNSNTRWILPKIVNIPPAFQEAIGGHPLIAQTLYQRGITTVEAARAFLNPENYQPSPPNDLQDMEIAYKLIKNAIQNNHKILVWGDFDVDGQTATTILVEGMRQAGGRVSYHIPIRAHESHGIRQAALKEELKAGFDLLITCDTGISEHESIQLVRNLGIPVIVTDHHSLGKSLPPANAIINPQRLEPKHPLRTLPGAGVAYKLIEGLFDYLGLSVNTNPLLELAALGIVADVADLQGDTRYLLQKGLFNLRHTHRIGLQLLYQNAGLNPKHLNEEHIGFQIAPRLNAVGRLGDANPMVEFLTTQDEARARVLAYQIEAYNTKRRFDTHQVEQGAEQQLADSSSDKHAPVIILHHPTWPGGIVGIVASRLADRYNKPVILLTGEEQIHGSARSIPGFNITEAIAAQANLLTTFGGHPMAAGLSMTPNNLSVFKRQFLTIAESQLKHTEVTKEIQVTQKVSLDQINLDFIHEINRLAPFGPGNPSLLFQLSDLQLISESRVGANQEHRQVVVADKDANELRLIWWNSGDEALPEAEFNLVCKLSLSDYKGSEQLSAEWIDFKLTEAGIENVAERRIEIIDYRNSNNPLQQLRQLINKYPFGSLWGEGNLPEGFSFQRRSELKKNQSLIIWTMPPSQSVLRDVITLTKPKTVTVFAENPNYDDYRGFLTRLGGLAKFSLAHLNGEINLENAAAACGSTVESVIFGLRLWAAKGAFQFCIEGGSVFLTVPGDKLDTALAQQYEILLNNSLEESVAFRTFFKMGDLNSMIT